MEVLGDGGGTVRPRAKTESSVLLGACAIQKGSSCGPAAECWSGHWDWNQSDSFGSLTRLSNYYLLGKKKSKTDVFYSVSAEHSTIAVFNKYSGGS